MSSSPLPAELLADRARDRHGVFTEADAFQAGLDRDDVLRMVRQGWWRVVHPGVMVSSSVPLHDPVRHAAALAFFGSSALLSHTTAAALQRLEVVADRRVFVTVPVSCFGRKRPGIVVMRTRHVPEQAVAGGFPVTPVPRTLVDLARDLDETSLTRVVADAVRRRHTTIERTLAMAEGMGGRAGISLLRKVCDQIDPDFESVLEEKALPHLTAAGLVDVIRQFEVVDELGRFVGRLDFAVPGIKLAVEIDGWGYHSSPEARNRDARRDRRLAALGWTVLRFTTDDVRRHPERIVTELRAVLQRLSTAA